MNAYPMTSSEELAEQIALDLLSATRAGQLTWTSAEHDERYVELDAGRISIKSRDDDGMHPYVLRVLDRHGDQLTELITRPAADAWDDTRPPAPWNTVLKQLHQAAMDSDGEHLQVLTRIREQAGELTARWVSDAADTPFGTDAPDASSDDHGDDAESAGPGDEEAASANGSDRPASSVTRPFGEAKRPLVGERPFGESGGDQAS